MNPNSARNSHTLANVACAVLALACGQLLAQSERDPTVAPQQSVAAPAANTAQSQVPAPALPAGAESLEQRLRVPELPREAELGELQQDGRGRGGGWELVEWADGHGGRA